MKKSIKKSRRMHFNLLDFIIVLVLIGVLGYGVYSYTRGAEKEAQLNVTMALEVTQKEPDMFSELKSGQKVSDHVKNVYLGTLKSYETKQSMVVSENTQEGTFVLTELPGRQDAVLMVDFKAGVSGIDLILNKTALKIGAPLTVRVGNTAFNTTIIGIEYDKSEYGRLSKND